MKKIIVLVFALLLTTVPSWAFPPIFGGGGSGGGTWGSITGTLSDQTDLNSSLSGKQSSDADLTSIAGGVTGIVKGLGNGNGFSAATEGTDYCGPAPVVNCSAGCSPTAAQLKCGAILENYGWASGAVAVTLPAIGASMSFRVDINTTQAGPTTHTVTSAAANGMDLDDVSIGKDYIVFATPTAGNGYFCQAFRTGASAWKWRCFTLNGTPTGGDL